MESAFTIILMLAGIAFMLWIYLFLPAQMAEERGRSGLGWVLISIFFSPVVAIIGLLVLGDTFERYEQRKHANGGRT